MPMDSISVSVLKHCVYYVLYGCWKLFEVAVSLNHDIKIKTHVDSTSYHLPHNLSQLVLVRV
jgi:hypothetical protein